MSAASKPCARCGYEQRGDWERAGSVLWRPLWSASPGGVHVPYALAAELAQPPPLVVWRYEVLWEPACFGLVEDAADES